MKENERRELVEKYKNEIGAFLEKVPTDEKPVVSLIVERIAYLAAHLEEIEEETLKKGLLTKGKGSTGNMVTKINPLVNAYVSYAKQFTASVKQLQGFLDNLQPEEKDELQQFMEKYK
jgi:hypothetical protein